MGQSTRRAVFWWAGNGGSESLMAMEAEFGMRRIELVHYAANVAIMAV